MKTLLFAALIFSFTRSAFAMPCDTGWSCTSKTGKYMISVQRCRYTNDIGSLESLKVNGSDVKGAELTATYDSLSIGGKVLALEVSVPDSTNDARYMSFEYNGKKGTVTERIQEANPGPQKVVASERITCQQIE